MDIASSFIFEITLNLFVLNFVRLFYEITFIWVEFITGWLIRLSRN